MWLGPVFEREIAMAPRARGLYVARAVYASVLVAIVATCWLVVTGTESINSAGDTARFGATLLRILSPLQLVLAVLAAAMVAAVSVSMEKERRTLELLLISRLYDRELVLGKLAASVVQVTLLLVSAIPIFAIVLLFGGVTALQLIRVFLVTAAASLAAASIATTVGFWRDTAFQTLSITAFAIVAWMACGEMCLFFFGPSVAAMISPARAVYAALEPTGGSRFIPFLGVTVAIIAATNFVAVFNVRRWNVAADGKFGVQDAEYESDDLLTLGRQPAGSRVSEQSGSVNLDPGNNPLRPTITRDIVRGTSREVWKNPILWREICTRAYGRKIVVVRLAWMLLFAGSAAIIFGEMQKNRPDHSAITIAIVPMVLASLVAVTALAVTSITSERDRNAFDLLLVSDLSPQELIWGKLLGVLAVSREIVIVPLVLCGFLVGTGAVSLENGIYLALGMATLVFFCDVLGVHVGLSYERSARAIAVSLGTVVFLFVGVATAMRIMVSFGSSFELQLAPFLAVIVGGAVGLYAALSARNPSPAIGWASALLPVLTFVAITSFLQGNALQVFLVAGVAYGFATAALLVPAIGAFDTLTGRASSLE